MAEYIERESAIAKCREIAACEWNHRASPVSWADAYEQFAEDIEELPSADVAPVRHGRWIPVDGDWETPCDEWDCTACGERRTFMCEMDVDDMRDYYKYCPNCGAKMDAIK